MTDYNHSKPDFPEDIKQTLLNETAESSPGLEYELPDGEVTYLVDEATEYNPWPRQYMEKTPT